MIYSPFIVLQASHSRPSAAADDPNSQNDIIRGSLGALRVQGGGDIPHGCFRRNLAQDQRRLQLSCSRPTDARSQQRCNGPILHQTGQRVPVRHQVFVRQRAEDRQVLPSWRCGT